jgi:hypothetical protein
MFHQGPQGPEGLLRGWKGSYRENPESEGVQGSLLSDTEEEEKGSEKTGRKVSNDEEGD